MFVVYMPQVHVNNLNYALVSYPAMKSRKPVDISRCASGIHFIINKYTALAQGVPHDLWAISRALIGRELYYGHKNIDSWKWSHRGAIDLIHDARHICTPLRSDGIKAMSRGFSGGKQAIKSANTRNRGCVCLF